jgi:hypothetical protein
MSTLLGEMFCIDAISFEERFNLSMAQRFFSPSVKFGNLA